MVAVAELAERLLRCQLEIAFQRHTVLVLGRTLTADEVNECVTRHLAAMNRVTA